IDESLLASSVDVNKCHYGDVLYPDMNDCNFVLCASRIECQTPPVEDDEVEVVTTDVTAPVLSITSSVVDGNSIRVYFTATDNNAIETFDRNYTGSTNFVEFTPVTVTTNNYYLDLNLSYSTDYNFCIKAIDYNSNYTVDCDTNTTDDAPVSQTVLALREGLVGYWPFESNLDDYGIYATHHGTMGLGTEIYLTGQVGNAINLNSSAYITVPYSDETNIGLGNNTFCAWAKDIESGERCIISQAALSGSNTGGYWNPCYNGRFRGEVWGTESGGQYIDSTTTICNDTSNWHYFCKVINGTNMSIYIDGLYNNGRTISVTRQATIEVPILIGTAAGSRSVQGYLDEVAIWNRALSANDINNLYNSGNGLSLRTD
ncbi:MAG: LamG domain-containing protein, partial [Candidatus ainarchaeum sp.]|nr:LamG domain-containing protein [Candidatus ainarchaeum sp.]